MNISTDQLFNVYRPSYDWYQGNVFGDHGISHAARVLYWANCIGRFMQKSGESVDLDVVRWSAVLHDIRRKTDGHDPEHGERAANWIMSRPFAGIRELSSEKLKMIAYCCEWHVPHDFQAPYTSPELICLKDADSLDRVRFGTLKLGYLRTSYARQLVLKSRILAEVTTIEDQVDPWINVVIAANALRRSKTIENLNITCDSKCYAC